MIKGFKEFLLRGNVIDLAVAVVVGTAFTALVNSFVKDILTPLIAAIVGKPDFSNLTITIHKSQFFYGSFINALISFVLIATAVYFFVVVPMNKLQQMRERGQGPEEEVPDDIALLREIRDELRARPRP